MAETTSRDAVDNIVTSYPSQQVYRQCNHCQICCYDNHPDFTVGCYPVESIGNEPANTAAADTHNIMDTLRKFDDIRNGSRAATEAGLRRLEEKTRQRLEQRRLQKQQRLHQQVATSRQINQTSSTDGDVQIFSSSGSNLVRPSSGGLATSGSLLRLLSSQRQTSSGFNNLLPSSASDDGQVSSGSSVHGTRDQSANVDRKTSIRNVKQSSETIVHKRMSRDVAMSSSKTDNQLTGGIDKATSTDDTIPGRTNNPESHIADVTGSRQATGVNSYTVRDGVDGITSLMLVSPCGGTSRYQPDRPASPCDGEMQPETRYCASGLTAASLAASISTSRDFTGLLNGQKKKPPLTVLELFDKFDEIRLASMKKRQEMCSSAIVNKKKSGVD